MRNRLKVAATIALTAALGCGQQSAEQSKDQPGMSRNDFDLQGHRGARGLFPENSIEGFIAALDLQVNTLEMDVVITADSQVVVSHEPWIDGSICSDAFDRPLPKGKGLNIFKMPYSEVTNYNCGILPHPRFPHQIKIPTFKPLLSEVIEQAEKFANEKELPPVNYSIEVKSSSEGDNEFHPEPRTFVRLVLQEIEKAGIAQRVIIQSFDVRALREVKEQSPVTPVAYLISETEGFERDLERLGFVPEIYSPYYKLVDELMVQNCRTNGIRIIPWTVNDEDEMTDLLELGVDGLITDYPDLALTLKP